MVREVLILRTDNGLGDNNPTFKDIEITEYSFDSPRMGMPTLTATLMWATCLDKEWTGKEYVVLRGEKYYVRNTPTWEKNNTDERYKHSLEFSSEREQLGKSYFYDVVPSDLNPENVATHDRPNTNSTTFKLFGTIQEYADRLNCAFRYSGIGDSILDTKTTLTDSDTPVGDGYCVVVSTTGEADLTISKEISFEDQWLWDALVEGYNQYKIPFAFRGKKIVFNEKITPLSHVFKYGFDNELLSIKKNNANAKIVNRITFKGSSENIPYYYPNTTEYGNITLHVKPTNNVLTDLDNEDIRSMSLMLSKLRADEEVHVVKYQQVIGASGSLAVRPDTNPVSGNFRDYTNGSWVKATNHSSTEYDGTPFRVRYRMKIEVGASGTVILSAINGAGWNNGTATLPDIANASVSNLIKSRDFIIDDLTTLDGNLSYKKDVIPTSEGLEMNLIQGSFYLYFSVAWPSGLGDYRGDGFADYIFWAITEVKFSDNADKPVYYWANSEGKKVADYDAIGVNLPKISDAIIGDTIYWTASERMPFQTNLMPPKYRQTLGKERFYNALNNTYPDGANGYLSFKHPFIEGNPNEYIYEDDTIKPTIAGIKNAAGELFGQIADIAFDDNDNDSLKAIEGTVAGEDSDADVADYAHSFFYIKLHKFDGEYGFSLFDSASQTNAMTLQMTSGKCNGCKFKVQVIKNEELNDKFWRNPVQTDSSGNIVGGDYNSKVNKGNPQEWQQDTRTESVWICLQKDTDTFGVIMPNRSHNYLPEAGDTFNIIDIDLPQAYIDAAEKRGEEAMLKFMQENNEEKFTFDISASRIFFADNPDILALLDENSKLRIMADGIEYVQYVSSFGIECKNGEALPNVKLSLVQELAVGESFVQNIVSSTVSIVGENGGGSGSGTGGVDAAQGDKRYLRKDKDDKSQYGIGSMSHFELGEFVSGTSGGMFFIDPETGESVMELDRLKVRMKAIFEQLDVAHTDNVKGKLVITKGGGLTIMFVEELDNVYRCYFKQAEADKGITCALQAGDEVICKEYNVTDGLTANASNKFYWRKVEAVNNNDAYIDLSKTDCAAESGVPSAGDTIVHYGAHDDASRMSAIVLSTVDSFEPSVTLHSGITHYNDNGTEVVQFGVDKTKTPPRPFFHCYGETFVGPKDGSTYVKFTPENGVEIKGKLSLLSTLGDTTIENYISDAAKRATDDFNYLKEALKANTVIDGGLVFSQLIKLGEWSGTGDNATMEHVWSGHNGKYVDGRTIASWWGGDMVDRFDASDNIIEPVPDSAAAALVRMDGSAYFSQGNVGFRKDGSGWLGNYYTGIRFLSDGTLILGSGITVGGGTSGTGSTALASILNFMSNLTHLLRPVNDKLEDLEWSEADTTKCYALKAVKGFFSNSFVSAHGHNPDGGGGSGGGGAAYDRLDAWADYSTDREGWVLSALLGHDLHTRLEAIEGDYVKLSDLPSLTGYATEQWVLGKGYITQDALTSYLTKTDADGKFVTALGVSGKFLTWARNGVTNNLTVPFATDADTVDGYHESSFLRARGFTRIAQEETLWDQIGIKGQYAALPDGLDPATVYDYGQVITLCETAARFEIYASHNSSAGNGLYFRTGWNNSKRPWQMLLDTGNYSTILDGRYSHTLTLQLNGTEIGTFNPTANKTINIGDVASAAALASHTGNTTVHISATERALWNKAASDLSTILGSDSDTVINKWEEVVAFLDTYTEADTLAGLLGNKVDKVTGYGLSKNDFNDTLLAKLNGIEAGANRYVLPTASATVKGGAKIGSGLMMASEVLSVSLNASHIPALDWSKIATGKPTTLGGYGITDAYTRAESNGLFAPAVAYNYSNGCLVRLTTLEHRSTFLTILIEGNTYYGEKPVKSIIQFYNYDSPTAPIIGAGATHYGRDFGNINAFNYDGHVYVWFKQIDSITTFFVTAYESAGEQRIGNIVDTITNAPMPTEGVTRLVTIYPTKGLRTDNYASLLDSRYQQSANIHALTLAAGAFSAKTYDPKSAALTVNIPTTTDHITEGGNLYFTNARAVSALSSTTNALQAAINTKLSEATFNAFKTAFDSMLELVNIGTDAAPRYAIHAKYGLYSDSFLSAHGLNDAGGNGGSSYSRLDDWNAYDSSKEGYVLSAKLGYDLYRNKADSAALSALASRVGTLEGKNYLDALTLNQNGSGNAVTSVALSADKRTLTVTKGATFLTEHQDISGLLSKIEAESLYQPKGNYFRQGLGSLTTEVAFDIRSCQTNGIYGYNPYNFDEPYGTIVTFNDGYYGFGGQFYLPRLASSHISYRGRNDNTPNWSAWHKLAFTSDIPSLSGYATESWVLGKNYLTAITKAMVENVLTGNITSHTHSQYLTQHQSLAGYVTINTEQAISGNKNFTGIVRIIDNSATHDINTLPQLYFSIPGWCYTKFVYSKDDKLHLLDGAADLTGAHRTFVAGAFVKHGGTASQFLKADGSVDSNSYALASALNNYLPLAGGTMANTNLVTNLNADLLDGKHLSDILGSNVASATKLADNASYIAWGRPFFADGKPQNVRGGLTGVTDIAMSGVIRGAKYLYHSGIPTAVGGLGSAIGFGCADAEFGTFIWGTGDGKGHIQVGRKDGIQTAYSLILQEFGGNVGIGTTSPAYKLDVNGTAKISEGLLIGGLLSANGGISTSAITATEIHLGPITLKYEATNKGLQVIGGGLYTDSYLSAHGPSPTTVDYEARIAALENKIAQLESRLNA